MSNTQYHRGFTEKIRHLAQFFPAIVLSGARQTGKSTLLREAFPGHSYVSLDLPADAQLAEEDPDAFLRRYPPPVIVDEVQYAPALFRHLKVAIDADRQTAGRFILSGSQKFTLMREVSDSLAGRVALVELETLSVPELGGVFEDRRRTVGLGAVLARGFFPQLWAELDFPRADFYRSYLATYIERDVRQLLNIGSLRDFDRFMRVCATRSGQLLNKSDIAKDVGVAPNTANQWLSVLQASNQIVLLEPYHRNAGKRVVKSPKLYFADCGLASFLLGLNEETAQTSASWGALYETFVFAELRKALALDRPEATVWFYRDQQIEVDFLVDYGGKLHVAEAKAAALPSVRDFANAAKARSHYAAATPPPVVIAASAHGYPMGDAGQVVSAFELSQWVAAL